MFFLNSFVPAIHLDLGKRETNKDINNQASSVSIAELALQFNTLHCNYEGLFPLCLSRGNGITRIRCYFENYQKIMILGFIE